MTKRSDVKPITYLKNRTADLLREVSEGGHAVTITQNGEARAVLMSIVSVFHGDQDLAPALDVLR